MANALTMAVLQSIAAQIPPCPKWLWCVAKPELCLQLKDESSGRATYQTQQTGFVLGGIEIYPKPQMVDAWLFSDSKLLRKYLDGKASELDLFEALIKGKTKPFYTSGIELAYG